jgi:AbrB family looped-hinge helix DNA binding protein
VAKITSKRQVTIPKHIADEYGLGPGDDISWVAEGDTIRVLPRPDQEATPETISIEERLGLFDQATARQRSRERDRRRAGGRVSTAHRRPGRGWSRQELYDRGVSR